MAQVDTNSEEHKRECLVRHVARLMWVGNEDSQLAEFEKHQGREYANKLRIDAQDYVRNEREKLRGNV